MIIWTVKHPQATPAMLGYLHDMLSEDDPRPAREQLDTAYHYGGGWRPFQGFRMLEDGVAYPGDPVMPLLFETFLREETVRVYLHDWVAIIQPDGTFEVARMD